MPRESGIIMFSEPIEQLEFQKRGKRIQDKQKFRKHEEELDYVKNKRKKVKEGKRNVRNYMEEI